MWGSEPVYRKRSRTDAFSVLCSSTLSQCIHAAAALLYPFSWAHTYIPVVPESLLATVCCPTPFMVGVQMRFQQEVMDSPMEEVSCIRVYMVYSQEGFDLYPSSAPNSCVIWRSLLNLFKPEFISNMGITVSSC